MMLVFDGFVMNASGPRCTTRKELMNLQDAPTCAIVTKSVTMDERQGNPEPRYYSFDIGAVQSMGLPNLGFEFYRNLIPELKKRSSKPTIVNIAGLCNDDFKVMSKGFIEAGADALELNFSCPNITGKNQIGYNFKNVEEIVRKVSELDSPIPIGLKLPPYLDGSQFGYMSDIVREHKCIQFLTCVNSVGNTLVVDAEKETSVIRPNGGLGGLSGAAIKPIGLSNVYQFRKELGNDFPLIGVGGVKSGQDAFEYLLVGAIAVQIGECYMTEDVDCFRRINRELSDLLKRKGYSSLDQVRGKLRLL